MHRSFKSSIRCRSSSFLHPPIRTNLTYERKFVNSILGILSKNLHFRFKYCVNYDELTFSHSSSDNSFLSSNMDLICIAWSFSGRNCPRDIILLVFLGLDSSFDDWVRGMSKNSRLSQGGYILCVLFEHHSLLIWSSVQLEFTMVRSEYFPALRYRNANNWM